MLNEILPWSCFTTDGRGRRFGRAAWVGKRQEPQVIPDPRIVRMSQVFSLEDKHVLEVGCFEGVHTIALCQHAGRVTAIDARVENLAKTIVRAAMYGEFPRVLRWDVEEAPPLSLEVDVVHHVGVLYHLQDPIRHLRALGGLAREGIWLDTHVADPEEADADYESGGVTYPYKRYVEGGREDVFSGLYDHAKWLTLETISKVLTEAGFADVKVFERREERNGPRVLLAASR